MKAKKYYEAIAPEGLEEVVWEEIEGRFGEQVKLLNALGGEGGLLQFTYGGAPEKLLTLKGPFAVYSARRFDVPRPKALLGHENINIITALIDEIMEYTNRKNFHTLYLAAAGSDSDVMQRIVKEVSDRFGLEVSETEGDLLIRIRPARDVEAWDVLVRMTARPLSVRKWRVCDYPGALNAAVAAGILMLTECNADDVVLNVCCGSATLMIERAGLGPAARLIGCDINASALTCARANLKAAGLMDKHKPKSGKLHAVKLLLSTLQTVPRAEVYPWDATDLPLDDESVSMVISDLPFGHDVGSHDGNLLLYPKLLREAGRVAKSGAQGIFLTHEIRLMDTTLDVSAEWRVEGILPVHINGLNPRIYLLIKR